MRSIRYPAMLLCLLLLAGCQAEGEFRLHWKLWGFETHAFIVGDEENIAERIDRFYQVCRVLSPEGKNLVERLYPKS